MPETTTSPASSIPPSISKLLDLARRQSKQLEQLSLSNSEANPNEQRQSIGRNSIPGRKSLLDIAAEANPKELRKSVGRKSTRDRGSKSHLSKSSAIPTAEEPAQRSDNLPSRASEIQPAENSNKRPSRFSEIQHAQEPGESSYRGPRGSRRRTTRASLIMLDGGAEQLRELHARAVASGPSASLRKDLSYESFAISNFRLHTYWPSQPNEEVIHFSKTRISEPLLQSVHKRDKHDAVAGFAHLMAYMGDLSKTKSETDHLLQVMSGGLRKPDLRDEIFCQICKQTTANPDSVSNVRGWQAMALSCGLFSPSPNFLPVLEAHLEQVVHGIVGMGNNNKGKNGEEIVDPPHLATYSLFRLRKLLHVGARHLLPLPQEIAAVEKMGNITATIFLPDSTSKSFPLDPMVTTEEVVIKIVKILGFSESKYFCLWEVDPDQGERSLGKREYVAEVQSRWNSTCLPQSINDFQSPFKNLMTCWRFANKKIATVPDLGDTLLDHLFVMKCKGENKPKFLFKRNLFLGSQEPTISLNARNRELALDYSQAVHDVLRGAYPLAEQDLVMLAALQLRAELGSNLPENATDLKVSNYLPQHLEGKVENLKDNIVNFANALPDEPSPAARRIDYLDYLKTRYILAEASWFGAKEEILHLKYTQICSWAYSQTIFSIVTGNVSHNQEHRFMTLQERTWGRLCKFL